MCSFYNLHQKCFVLSFWTIVSIFDVRSLIPWTSFTFDLSENVSTAFKRVEMFFTMPVLVNNTERTTTYLVSLFLIWLYFVVMYLVSKAEVYYVYIDKLISCTNRYTLYTRCWYTCTYKDNMITYRSFFLNFSYILL